MNENEIQRIAAATNALRPDWPVPSLVTLLNKPGLANRSRRDVAVALTWIACDSTTKTPARVMEAGPWWQAVADPTEGGAPRIDWRDRCHVCNYAEAACRRVNGDDHEFTRNGDVADGRKRRPGVTVPMPNDIRAELRKAREQAQQANTDQEGEHGPQ